MIERETHELGGLGHGDFRRLANELAALIACGVVTEKAGLQVTGHGLRERLRTRVHKSVRHRVQLHNTHVARRERASLVGADDGHAPKRLDTREALDDRMSARHLQRTKRQRHRHDNRQSFRDRSDGK